MKSSANVSVVIPIWRDCEQLLPLIHRLKSCPQVREVIVSAAEPVAGLRDRVAMLGGIFMQTTSPNRGLQLNRGARIATGEWLLFHHADTAITPAHLAALVALDSSGVIGGAFYRQFDERHPRLQWLEKVERWHSRAFGTLYGDQSVFVRHDHFLRIGGYSEIPLMEDVELSRRLRASGKIKLLDPPLSSCANKQLECGAWKATIRNLLFLILFRCGVPAERLHHWYYARARV